MSKLSFIFSFDSRGFSCFTFPAVNWAFFLVTFERLVAVLALVKLAKSGVSATFGDRTSLEIRSVVLAGFGLLLFAKYYCWPFVFST